MSQAPIEALAENLRLQAIGCRHMGSPFYAGLLDLMAEDLEARGPVWTVLEPHVEETFGAAYPIRLLGGVHRMVLSDAAPALAAHFPTTGGDGDAEAAWPHYRALLATRPEPLLDTLTRPPQTNEVGRSASLAGGLAVVAGRTGLPLRLLEIGTSAALNLRLDRYWYEQDGAGWGDPDSAVRFVDLWSPARPPFEAAVVIATRRGCDRDPIDASRDEAALTLLSYVWPGQDGALRRAPRRARDRGRVPCRRRSGRRRRVAAAPARRRARGPRDRRDALGLLAVPRDRDTGIDRREPRRRRRSRHRTTRPLRGCGWSRRRRAPRPSCASRPGPVATKRCSPRPVSTPARCAG